MYKAFRLICIFLLTACGGGGGGATPTPSPAAITPTSTSSTSTSSTSTSSTSSPAPTVSLSSSSASVVLNTSVTITWSTTNATNCTAAGAWSGSKSTSGSEDISISVAGDNSFSLSCTGSGGSRSASTTVESYQASNNIVENGSWVQRGFDINGKPSDIIGDNDYEEKFGTSIAMSSDSNTIIIGAPHSDVMFEDVFSNQDLHKAGKARIYNWNGGAWIQQGQDIVSNRKYSCLKLDTLTGNQISGGNAGFGTSVAIDGAGDTVVIGAPRFVDSTCNMSGLAVAFNWDGGTWEKVLDNFSVNGSSGQGHQVAISNDGNRIITSDVGSMISLGSSFIANYSNTGNSVDRAFSHLAFWAENPSTYPEQKFDIFDWMISEDESSSVYGSFIWRHLTYSYSGLTCSEYEHTLCGNNLSWIRFPYCAQTGTSWNNPNIGSCEFFGWMRPTDNLFFGDVEGIVDASMAMSVTSSLDGVILSHEFVVINHERIAVLINLTQPYLEARVRVYGWIPPYEDVALGYTGLDKWEQLGTDIKLPSGYSIGALKLSSDGNTVAITANAIGQTSGPGHVRIYNWNNTDWIDQGDYINGETGDKVLQSIALSADGKTVAFGVPETGRGVVRIYDFK